MTTHNGQPTSYLVSINEDQRKGLIELIKTLPEEVREHEDHPLCYWLDMLEGLPEVETEHPGTVHGFCL